MRAFRTVFPATGILLGGCATVYYYIHSDNGLLVAGGIGIAAGTIYGLIVASLASLLARFLRVTILNFAVISLALAIAGLIAGDLVYVGINLIPRSGWTQILDAPETPVEFVGQSPFSFWGGSIFVRADQGNIYSYTCDSSQPCQWRSESEHPAPPERNYWSCDPERGGAYPTPWPPGVVIDTYEVNICGADYTNQINLLMLDDGTIWVWNRFSTALEIIFDFLLWSIGGAGIGMLSPWSLLINGPKMW